MSVDVDHPLGGPDASGAPLKVALVTLNYFPEETGNAAYTTSLAESLAARGVAVQVVAAAPHYPQWRTYQRSGWSRHTERNGVDVRRIRSYVPADPSWIRRAVFEILYGVRLGLRVPKDVDVVLLVSPGLLTSSTVEWLLGFRRVNSRKILWVQDRYVQGVMEVAGAKQGIAGRLITKVADRILRRSDEVVVIHERWKKEISDQFRLPAEKFQVIRNWTHVTVADASECDATRMRQGWGERGKEIIALHAGNMGVKQGLENVIRAAKLAETRALPLRFVLMGDGNQRTALEELAGHCGAVSFLPPQDEHEYVRLLGAADVLLLNEKPGMLSSAVPSKLTSYFITGRPVVAATESQSVSADEVRASGAGIVVTPGDPDALLWGIERAVADRQVLNGGKAYVDRVLSKDAAVSSFIKVFTNERDVEQAVALTGSRK